MYVDSGEAIEGEDAMDAGKSEGKGSFICIALYYVQVTTWSIVDYASVTSHNQLQTML